MALSLAGPAFPNGERTPVIAEAETVGTFQS